MTGIEDYKTFISTCFNMLTALETDIGSYSSFKILLYFPTEVLTPDCT